MVDVNNGSCVATFGYKVAGLFSNNQDLAKQLYDAGQQTGEYLWQLPIWDVYKKAIASDIADLKNNNQPPVAEPFPLPNSWKYLLKITKHGRI